MCAHARKNRKITALPMKKQQRDNILISFFKEKEKYEKLAGYIVRFIKDDPSAPGESIHTILYRIKKEARLIEKIDQENARAGADTPRITHSNFHKRIGDIIGIRIICLRLSDIVKVEAYLQFLIEEKILQLMQEPDHKRSFVLPIDPGKADLQKFNLQYSGYSSIHYQIRLGENSDASQAYKKIEVELQLRTILEEAWGEIDHKYRYVYNRMGCDLPKHIHSGFYNLSAYLQASAMQAEQLCREVEAHISSSSRTPGDKRTAAGACEPEGEPAFNNPADPSEMPPLLQPLLEETFGFKATARTLAYIVKRFNKSGYAQRSEIFFQEIFNTRRLNDFRKIYHDVLNQAPFMESHRDIDLINAVNFVLFSEIDGPKVAQEGLRSTLKWRKERLSI